MNGAYLPPAHLLEATNGVMLILFFFMLLTAAAYFIDKLRTGESAYVVYQESKASFAASILFFGLFLRAFVVWFSRHLEDHHIEMPGWQHVSTTTLILTGIPVIWGSVCWMNAVLPLRCGRWAWLMVAAVAVGFGIGMAM